jgi:hypothetical protein
LDWKLPAKLIDDSKKSEALALYKRIPHQLPSFDGEMSPIFIQCGRHITVSLNIKEPEA